MSLRLPITTEYVYIFALSTILYCLCLVTHTDGGVPFYSDVSINRDNGGGDGSSGDGSNSDSYENIHRILRDEENGQYRNENVRWKKMLSMEMDRRRTKRNTNAQHEPDKLVAKVNSTKIINFSNRNLERINFSELDFRESNIVFSDINVLNFSNNKIVDLLSSGIESFSNVERIDFSANRIVTFDSAFVKLTFLNLSCNRLEHFSGKRIRNVRVLDLSGNRISKTSNVDLQYLSDIEMIDLSCNQLTDLDRTLFENVTKLKILNLSGNRLIKIVKNYFFNLEHIQTLQLAGNLISNIENDTFSYLANLEYLDLSYNDINATSIRSLQGIPDLIGLSVAFNSHLGNALQGFVASWSLKELDASGTALCQIPAALAQSVHTLTIAHNHFQVN